MTREEIMEAALTEIARLRTDLSGDFSMGSRQSDIARKALSVIGASPAHASDEVPGKDQ
jgi:hypothetical protein